MAIYPGAVYKPTSHGGRTARNVQGRGILHVAVSGARSLPPWSGNTWHMYVAHDGYCEQYVDSALRAYASGDANDDAFQIETAGGLGSSAVLNAEKWTPAAAERLADIMAWLQRVDGTPLELLPDSKPGRRGWGPHRLGIQHSRGVGAVPGFLIAGGERWSSSIGKECPGNAKVAQVPQIIARARQIAGGAPPAQEDDMTPHEAEIAAYTAMRNLFLDMRNGHNNPARDAFANVVSAAASASIAPLQGQIAGLSEALKQVAAGTGQAIDLKAVQSAAKAGAAEALASGVEVDITVGGQTPTA